MAEEEGTCGLRGTVLYTGAGEDLGERPGLETGTLPQKLDSLQTIGRL